MYKRFTAIFLMICLLAGCVGRRSVANATEDSGARLLDVVNSDETDTDAQPLNDAIADALHLDEGTDVVSDEVSGEESQTDKNVASGESSQEDSQADADAVGASDQAQQNDEVADGNATNDSQADVTVTDGSELLNDADKDASDSSEDEARSEDAAISNHSSGEEITDSSNEATSLSDNASDETPTDSSDLSDNTLDDTQTDASDATDASSTDPSDEVQSDLPDVETTQPTDETVPDNDTQEPSEGDSNDQSDNDSITDEDPLSVDNNNSVADGNENNVSDDDSATVDQNDFSDSDADSEIEDYSEIEEVEKQKEFTGTQSLQETLVASDGQSYRISVSYDESAGFPADAVLDVLELTGAEYEEYIRQAAGVMGADSFQYARVFDITVRDSEGAELIPASPVSVTIDLLDEAHGDEDFSVIHFGEEPEELTAQTQGDAVSFETAGFSAYVIVQGPAAGNSADWKKISDLDELEEYGATGVYIGHTTGFFLTSGITNITSSRTGITKTKPAQSTPPGAAVTYYFERITPDGDTFYIYCLADDGETKRYIVNSTNSLNLTTNVSQRTAFTISLKETDTFNALAPSGYYINMQGGANGNAFAAWSTYGDVNNNLYIWRRLATATDPYNLNGHSYGLLNWSGSVTGRAMLSEQNGTGSLKAKALDVMVHKDNPDQRLFVPKDSDIDFWTFEWVREDLYHIYTNTANGRKYLDITTSGLTLLDSVNVNTGLIKVTPGTGTRTGQISLSAGGRALTYMGSVAGGFGKGGTAGSEWLNLVDRSELTVDYYMVYSARKVSVSDPEVTNGSEIIIYTRVWDDSVKKYKYYALDHDGSLVQCFEYGDSIQWMGTRLNTMLWDFSEYYWEGTTDPNFYYDLYNPYSGTYIAPQHNNNQIVSDTKIGINLNGRRDGYYYTPIYAWDDDSYCYAALNADGGTLQVCPKSDAADFYFAIIEDVNEDDNLTMVPTVDHESLGMTLKMIDFTTKNNNNPNEQDTFLLSTKKDSLVTGLLSTKLGNDGYPTNGDGVSMATLYANAFPVNHLFIKSTYVGSGYYEFDSAQNFASIDGSNFKVYKEIASMDSGASISQRPSLQHGQFMPFNDLEAGLFAELNAKNLYTSLQEALPTSDPRYNEQLYLIKNPDHYFGMEMAASFTQTPSGKDDWGHDIIYEFTGDDDFWLYVDGELILDLGGMRSAVGGTVNYSTGRVKYAIDAKNHQREDTLYNIFKTNYKNRENCTEQEALDYVNGIFEQNANGDYVFKDYTSHTMRIFFMERGGGASNLYMRFNLASVRPGTVELSKKLDGVESQDSVQAEYPYQIWYKTPVGENEVSEPILLTQADGSDIKVFYKDSVRPVKHVASFTMPGSEGITYEHVFLLKPDEIAEIQIPDDAVSYKIVECGIDTDIYDWVKADGNQLDPVDITGHESSLYKDFEIPFEMVRYRPRVAYVNHVDPDSINVLTVEKRLYQADGVTEILNDSAVFAFRVYFAGQFDDECTAANMVTYHVRDAQGNYCSWSQANGFQSIGVSDFDSLTKQQRDAVSFTTSMNGSVSKIPVGCTVEFRDRLVGTKYKVEERDYEIPDGFSFQTYVIHEGSDTINTTSVIEKTMVKGVDPRVEVRNIKGWGLRINKTWLDAEYMDDREPAYFAIYTGTDEDSLVIVPNTVRRMEYENDTIYWYFASLPVNTDFENYNIREVAVTNPSIDANGVVTADSVTLVKEGNTVTINGLQKGETSASDYLYTVHYEKGIRAAGTNVRVDKAFNSRPGVSIVKADREGNPIEGTTFVLKKGTEPIGTYVSDETGFVTVAFLGKNIDYYLIETKATQGYVGLDYDVTIRMNTDGTISLSGSDQVASDVLQTTDSEGSPVLTVYNSPYELVFRKYDMQTMANVADAHFALHRQITVGNVTSVDLTPIAGFEDIVTNSEGLLVEITNLLPPGTYELREIEEPSGYEPLGGHIRFTVTEKGEVLLLNGPHTTLTTAVGEDTLKTVTYTVSIGNVPNGGIIAPTAVRTNPVPYYWILGFASVLLLGAAFFLLRRRRQAA